MNKLHILGGALVGLVVGSAGTYLLTKKKLEIKYAELARDEIAETRAYLNERHKDILTRRIAQIPKDVDDRVHEGPATDTLERVLEGLRYGPKTVPVGPPKKMNVFDELPTHDEMEYLEGQEPADTTKPFIIAEETWSGSMPIFEHVTYTYYSEDDTLADESDNIVDGIDNLVGEDNLLKFGLLSGDPDTVFIRNKKLRMDFEIVRTEGSYKAMVLGE